MARHKPNHNSDPFGTPATEKCHLSIPQGRRQSPANCLGRTDSAATLCDCGGGQSSWVCSSQRPWMLWSGSWGLGGWHRDAHQALKEAAQSCRSHSRAHLPTASTSSHAGVSRALLGSLTSFVQHNLHQQPLHLYSSFIFTLPTAVQQCFSPGKRQHLVPPPPGAQRQDLCSSLLQLAGALELQSPALIGMQTLYSISLSSCWHCLLVWMLQVTV